jgi:RNA polymerase sigma-70 factor (ECF subfamily)
VNAVAFHPFDLVLPAWLAGLVQPASPEMPDHRTMSETDEIRELIASAIDGDERAFAELIRRHKARIVRLVARFGRTPADLDELAQDVFIKAHRALHRYRHDAPFEHWLCRIATRCCQDYLRRLYRRRWFTSLDALRDAGFEPAPADSTDPRVETLRLALRRLPPDQQTVLTLFELEGHSVRDIAHFTGLSESNVKVRAHRARLALRAEFDLIARSETRARPPHESA